MKLYEQIKMKSCFNSKLVRLKEAAPTFWNSPARSFQFQTGAIKSIMIPTLATRHRQGFNSKLVRLKEKKLKIHALHLQAVSIPNWCD